MRSIEVPMEMSQNGLREKVDKVVALMADPANCSHPVNTLFKAVAIHLIFAVQSWPFTLVV